MQNSDGELTDEEDWRFINKPFQCPVRGCPKRYKNSNGVKYHRSHAHHDEVLVENDDGTFTALSGKSQEALAKEEAEAKPFVCAFCGKRYKNYNGLKYHKNHSVACQAPKNHSQFLYYDGS